MSFAELAAATNFSFLRGASHPGDMVGRALELGMAGIGIADRNSVAGVVRAWSDRPPSSWLAMVEIALCLALFAACALHVSLRLRKRAS